MLPLATSPDLTAILVGASVTLAGTVLVQLWVIPRIEWWKRSQARWEEALNELSQLLTVDYEKAVTRLRGSANAHAHVLGQQEKAEQEGTDFTLPDDYGATAFRSRARAAEDVKAHHERMDWLINQVVGWPPTQRR